MSLYYFIHMTWCVIFCKLNLLVSISMICPNRAAKKAAEAAAPAPPPAVSSLPAVSSPPAPQSPVASPKESTPSAAGKKKFGMKFGRKK